MWHDWQLAPVRLAKRGNAEAVHAHADTVSMTSAVRNVFMDLVLAINGGIGEPDAPT